LKKLKKISMKDIICQLAKDNFIRYKGKQGGL